VKGLVPVLVRFFTAFRMTRLAVVLEPLRTTNTWYYPDTVSVMIKCRGYVELLQFMSFGHVVQEY